MKSERVVSVAAASTVFLRLLHSRRPERLERDEFDGGGQRATRSASLRERSAEIWILVAMATNTLSRFGAR
jgi:hypothetical protein